MSKAESIATHDPKNLPARLTLTEVLALARYGRTTLRTRQAAGKMPMHIDRGGGGYIFDRDAVLKALGLFEDSAKPDDHDPWDFEPGEINRALAEQREKSKAYRRLEIRKKT